MNSTSQPRESLKGYHNYIHCFFVFFPVACGSLLRADIHRTGERGGHSDLRRHHIHSDIAGLCEQVLAQVCEENTRPYSSSTHCGEFFAVLTVTMHSEVYFVEEIAEWNGDR